MAEHASEINTILIWVLIAGGGLFLGLVKWLGGQLMKKLSGIESAIEKTNLTLASIERDLRSDLSNLDRRVTKIETRCQVEHKFND